jgi:hypothetical protein
MTSREKITSAQTSKNLQDPPSGELGDIDIIRACGMAGQSNPLGLSIWRWRYAGDNREIHKIAEALMGMGHEVDTVFTVLQHLSREVCPVCFGRGYGVVEGTPILNGEICMDCNGTGKRQLHGDAELALVEVIVRLERDVARQIQQKLSTAE